MTVAVAFDFDGVLVDSNSVKRSAFFDVFAPFDESAADVEAVLREQRELDRFGVIAEVLRRVEARDELARPDGLAAELAGRYGEICDEHASVCPEIRGASDALRELAGRYRLYVNSATPEGPLRRIVTRRGWDGLFEAVLGRPRGKAENLLEILGRSSARPDELVFVGDGAGDLAAARAVGCRFVGVRDDDGEFRAHGVDVLDDLRGLAALILAGQPHEPARC
jgi:phosphoglycolate phosphatase-like HAD superfamily hydrolase